MNTWSTENTWSIKEFQTKKKKINFLCSCLDFFFGCFFFLVIFCITLRTKIYFFLLIRVARYPGWTMSYLLILLKVMKVYIVYPECIEVFLSYEMFTWNAALGKGDFPWTDGARFSIKLSAIFPFYTPGNYTLDVFSFAVLILFITVKAVMTCKLCIQEILFKGSPFFIIL